MKIIKNGSTDPYFNLACEEYLIDNSKEDIFMLWRNSPSVIIGRNQNAYGEINESYCKEQGIKVVRRLTGGGAVFHDLGNVNYTFVTDSDKTAALDFERFCRPIISSIEKLGVKANLSGRNDIMANGKKISGTAQCVRNNRLMHHGCILYCTDLSSVENALKVNEEKMQSKGIKSIRSRVANLSDLIENAPNVESFIDYIESESKGEITELSESEKSAIEKIAKDKYMTWEWNFGKSKIFAKTNTKRFHFGTVTLKYTLEFGIVADVKIEGDFFGIADPEDLCKMIKGRRYDNNLFNGIDVESFIKGATNKEIMSLFCE